MDGDPGLGGVPSGGGSIGTGTPGGSGTVPLPPGPARQFLHLVPAGTSVLQGSPHSLILRKVRTASGTRWPWDTCLDARWLIKPLRDLWRRESGQDGKGHECDGGPDSATFSGSESSLFPFGAPPNTTGTKGTWRPLAFALPSPIYHHVSDIIGFHGDLVLRRDGSG